MKKWENRENLPEARANHRGVNIGNVFLVIGGWGPEPPPPATTTQAPTIPGGGGSSAFGGWGGWTSGSSATFATVGASATNTVGASATTTVGATATTDGAPTTTATTGGAFTATGGASAVTDGAPTFENSIGTAVPTIDPLTTTHKIVEYTKLSEVLWFENPKTQPKWTRMNSIQTPRQRHAVSVIKRTEMAAACVRWIRSPNYPDNYPNRYDEVVIIDLHHIIFVLSLLYISKCKII